MHGAVVACVDITRRKRAAIELQIAHDARALANDELERRVAALTQELSHALVQLRELWAYSQQVREDERPRIARISVPCLNVQTQGAQTMNRNDVTEKIIGTKVSKGLQWEAIAKKVGQSKEWTTALCLGQMTASPAQAKVLGKIFGLTADEQKWLQVVPYKGSLPTPVPTDPLIYRWYEIVSVYGSTIKELIHEEFGDGIMSAIDFKMDITREADPKGDRVNVVLSGKFLPYKQY